MELVIDANILFAALIKEGVTTDLFFKNKLYAPEFLLEEFAKYTNLVRKKTKRSEEEFELFLRILKRRIEIVPFEEIIPFIDKAKVISPDIKDIAYVALALRLNCAIWSNDKDLKEKQTVAKVYSTVRMIL